MNLSERQRQCLKLMDIDVWVQRNPAAAPMTPVQAVEAEPERDVKPAVAMDESAWKALQSEVAVCTRCVLHETRTQTVFGVGNPAAHWLVIGEAPGQEEDRQGEPFVGRAGKLLNSMLEAMGLKREEVFIANILKCRPPNNREPKPEEAQSCESYLKRQIAMIQPKIILALGRIAAQNLLKVETPIGKMRGQQYEYPDPKVPVVVSYHPAYLLRSPREKRKSWDDLKFAMRVYKEHL